MSGDSPFKRESSKEKIKQDGDAICPFMGNSMIPVVNQPRIIQGRAVPDVEMQAQFWPCQEHRCAMWNAEREACSVKLGMDALSRIEPSLEPLGKFFGAKNG